MSTSDLRRIVVGALLAAWLVLPGVLRAQAERDAERHEPGAYKAAIHSAIEEFERGNFEEAREHFARAHALYPNARTLRGLGMSEFELRNYVDAVTSLELALAAHEKPLDGALREETVALLKRAQVYVGEVSLQLSPSTTAVRVDGFPVALDARRRLRLEVGDHVLEFSAKDYLSERRAIKVRGEQALTLEVSLVAPPTGAPSSPARVAAHADTRDSAPHTPLYKRWWLWTGVGALVAGGVIAGVVLATRDAKVAEPDGGSTDAVLRF